MFKNKSTLWWLIRASKIFTLICLGIYIWHFRNMKWSYETQDWGAFGEYLNFIVTVVNTAILGYLSFLVIETQRKRDAFETKFIEAAEKPTLIFSFDRASGKWSAYNVGKGAALNVVIAEGDNNEEWDHSRRTNSRKCYSLAPEEEFTIEWFKEAGRILGIYSDTLSNKTYTSVCKDAETEVEVHTSADIDANHWIAKVKQQAVRL